MLTLLLAAAFGHGGLPGGLAVTPAGEAWVVVWRCPDALSGHTRVVWPPSCAASAPTRARDDDLGLAVTAWTLRCPEPPEVVVEGLSLDDPPVVRRDPSGLTLLHPAAPGVITPWPPAPARACDVGGVGLSALVLLALRRTATTPAPCRPPRRC